jgi:hypothetical protein
MHSFLQDVRYGLRMLGRSPSFTALAILTLALGIGASTAVFSAVNALVLRPLPGEGNGQLLAVAFRDPRDADSHKMSYLDYKDFQQQSVSFADLTAYDLGFGVLTADQRSDRLLVSYVPGNFFSVLGMQPAVGRLFYPEEGDQPSTTQSLVLGYSYWQQRFGGDPRIVGKSVTLRGRSIAILGVAPQEFVGPFTPIETDAYLPMGMMPETLGGSNFFTDRSDRELYVLAKPKSGASRPPDACLFAGHCQPAGARISSNKYGDGCQCPPREAGSPRAIGFLRHASCRRYIPGDGGTTPYYCLRRRDQSPSGSRIES